MQLNSSPRTEPTARGPLRFSPECAEFLRRVLSGTGAVWPAGDADHEARFLIAIEHHGAAGILRAALRSFPDAALPAGVTAALASAAAGVAARNTLRIREAVDVLTALRERGVQAVTLKGLALLAVAYEHVGLRPMADLDFLVAPEQLAAADAALRSVGYGRALMEAPERVHHWAYARDAGGIMEAVEVHRHLFAVPPLETLARTDEILTRAAPASLQGHGLSVLGPEDLLLHVAGHLTVQHAHQERLIWVADVDRAVRGGPTGQFAPNWDVAWMRARTWQLAPALADALEAANHWFGTPVRIESVSGAEREAYRRMRRRAPIGMEGARLVHDVAASGSFRERAVRVREAALPPPAFMRAWYGVESNWRLPVVYARRWMHGVADVVANARRSQPDGSQDPKLWMVEEPRTEVDEEQTPSSRLDLESEPRP